MILHGISQVIMAILLSVLLGPCLAIATDDPQEPTALTGGSVVPGKKEGKGLRFPHHIHSCQPGG